MKNGNLVQELKVGDSLVLSFGDLTMQILCQKVAAQGRCKLVINGPREIGVRRINSRDVKQAEEEAIE
jgi:hypothetical protein